VLCCCCCCCRSVLWGRSVFSSIRKFLQFQLTVNFVALVVSFVGALVGGRMPLNVLQVRPFLAREHPFPHTSTLYWTVSARI